MAWFRTFASGSSGNCCVVCSDSGKAVLIDCGISFKKLKECLNNSEISSEDIEGILITHEHTDHTSGLATLLGKWDIPVYATAGTAGALRNKDSFVADSIINISVGQVINTGNFSFLSYRTSHDAAESCGFRLLFSEGRSLSIVTDLGILSESVLNSVSGSSAVILESNHDVDMLKNGPYPARLKTRILGDKGHLSNESAGAAAISLALSGTKRILLAHLSRKNNTPAEAERTVRNSLEENGFRNFPLSVAPASEMSEKFLI